MNSNVLKTFNAMVISADQISSTPNLSMVSYGVVTNFIPTYDQQQIIATQFQPLPITTLFGRAERLSLTSLELISKQLMHYIEVYGLGAPGIFNLEVIEGVSIKATYIEGITEQQLGDKVRTLLYSNAPIADTGTIHQIIENYDIEYDFDRILNNEMRIRLYNPQTNKFRDGDEAIRYMVYLATGNTLVIKNAKMMDDIRRIAIPNQFFENNDYILSQVFNRFKPLILAAKKPHNRTVINKIARMSKVNHKRVYLSRSKDFVSLMISAIQAGFGSEIYNDNIGKLNVRDVFKILNYIEYKKLGYDVDSFIIRNGTIHIETNRPKLDTQALSIIKHMLLNTLRDLYKDLINKRILLDSRVDYGLPISRKQTIGNLPFGTTIEVDTPEISVGMYWENSWGATDLDLSSIDLNGNRTGWGGSSAYATDGEITFSGDVTYAQDGAMEFFTSESAKYGLYVNIYSGNPNAGFELVIGTPSDKFWLTNTVIREKSTLMGLGSIVGFVNGNKFTVFQGKLNDRNANFGESSPVINRASAPMWTVRKLFDAIGVKYDTVAGNQNYDFNLSYDRFLLDKLEEILYK